MSLVIGRFKKEMYKDNLHEEVSSTGEYNPEKHFYIKVKILDNSPQGKMFYIFGSEEANLLLTDNIKNTYKSNLVDESKVINLRNIIRELLIKSGLTVEVSCVQSTESCPDSPTV